MHFAKAHSLGNDFILIKSDSNFSRDYIQRIANYKTGIGCDQVLVMNSKHHVIFFNQDGSSAKLCLNGLRALTMWIGLPQITFSISLGKVQARILGNGLVKINIGYPVKLEQQGCVFFVNVGNDHKIFFLKDDNYNLQEYKSEEYNVSCVVQKSDGFHARVWELGVGETLSCGSAALSAAHCLVHMGKEDLKIHFKRGTIEHSKEEDGISQTGPAVIIAIGQLLI